MSFAANTRSMCKILLSAFESKHFMLESREIFYFLSNYQENAQICGK